MDAPLLRDLSGQTISESADALQRSIDEGAHHIRLCLSK